MEAGKVTDEYLNILIRQPSDASSVGFLYIYSLAERGCLIRAAQLKLSKDKDGIRPWRF